MPTPRHLARRLLLVAAATGVPAAAQDSRDIEATEIHVVADGTWQPLAEATVHVLRTAELGEDAGVAFAPSLLDWEQLFERHGERHVADSEGRLHVAIAPGERVDLLGRSPGHWGLDWAGANHERAKLLRLFPAQPVRVRVVTPDGAPAPGVPVGLRMADLGGNYDHRPGITDSDGWTQIRHVRAIEHHIEPTEGIFARVASLFRPPLQARVDLEGLEEPLELVMPSHGTLRVEVDDPTGEALLLVSVPGEEELRESVACEVEDGVAVLAPVGLGLELELQLFTKRGTELGSIRGRGPESPSEARTLRIAARDIDRLRGRLLSPDGAPLTAALEVIMFTELREGDGAPLESIGTEVELDRRTIQTGEDGTFELELEPPVAERISSVSFTAVSQRHHGLHGRAERFDRSRRGLLDVGDVALSPPLLLASGTVVDHSGAPATDVEVRGSFEGSTARHYCWVDARGRFELRGRVDGSTLTLEAGWVSGLPPVEVPVGATGVRLVVPGEGTLVVPVLLDEGVDPSLVTIAAVGAQLSSAGDCTVLPCEFELPPGTYKVLAKSGAEEILATIEASTVISAETTNAPALDLRGRLRDVDVLVTSSAGSPIAQATVELKRDDGEYYGGFLATDDEGRVRFVTARPTVDLQLKAPSYRTTRIAGVVDAIGVQLTDGYPVPVQVRAPHLSDGESLSVCLSLHDELWQWDDEAGWIECTG